MIPWEFKGRELVNRSCEHGCPCQFNALPDKGHCYGLVGIIIDIEATREVNDGSRGPLITTERAEPGDVLVAVRDLGLRVKPEHLKQALDAFYTPEPGGMGMRLATSRSIVNSHGGPPVDDTERPAGAIFQFTAPAA